MEPDLRHRLPDGRILAVDDRGDADGTPVLYLHGTPDSRRARHPDDGLATAAGIRLLAVDRPGIGASDADPGATPASVADDLVHLLDALGVEEAGVLAWSAGAVFALALAGAHPARVTRLVLVGPLVPADAYDDPGVLEGADDGRRLFADAHRGQDPGDVGAELAPWLVPPVVDDELAAELLASSLAEVADVPGAGAALVAGLGDAVAGGLTGVEREIAAQATRLGSLLDGAATVPASVHVGDDDRTAPPAMARWVAARLGAPCTTHPGAGHALAVTAWAALLDEVAGRAARP